MSVPDEILQTALPLPLIAGLLTPPAQATLLLSLPTMVKVTVPVGFVPETAVVGVTTAVKLTA